MLSEIGIDRASRYNTYYAGVSNHVRETMEGGVDWLAGGGPGVKFIECIAT